MIMDIVIKVSKNILKIINTSGDILKYPELVLERGDPESHIKDHQVSIPELEA